MKDGLLDRIQGVGYWRVNIRPKNRLAEPLTFTRCREIVSASRVSIRGWDYPHMASRQDESGGETRGSDYYENWCDWWNQIEFWRMYKSGQFLSYNALWEDIVEDKSPSPKGTLEILDTIYSVTEFVEFSHRMMSQSEISTDISLNISLNNNADRRLSVGPGRMPFFDQKTTAADKIELCRDLTISESVERQRSIAIDMLLELFDFFGWNPARSQIERDQEKFFRREFG